MFRLLIPSLLAPIQRLPGSSENGKGSMMKTIEVITEIIRNPKPAFRKADDRPVKAQKHRYERRKIKGFLKLGDWAEEGAT